MVTPMIPNNLYLPSFDFNAHMTKNHRQRQIIGNEMRCLIIDHLNNGLSFKQVSDITKVNYNTVRSIYSAYKKTGLSMKMDTGRRLSKLNNEHKSAICAWIDEDCLLSCKELCAKLFVGYGMDVSESTVRRVLKSFHCTIKRLSLVPENRNSGRSIEERYNFALWYNSKLAEKEKIYFLDEYGIKVWSRINYGYAIRGLRANKTVRSIRSRNYSVCSAMNCEGLHLFKIQDRPYNSESYSEFIRMLIEKLENDGVRGAYFVMDNVAFHKTEQIRNLIRMSGHEIIFLPPYSPFLNPIEEVFNQWKWWIKHGQATNEEELYRLIHVSSENITPQNCSNYFRHMESYLHMCLTRQEIQN